MKSTRIFEVESDDKKNLVSEAVSMVLYGLNVLNSLCEGVDCAHQVWWLAGGFPAYITGKTKLFSDLDLYVCCQGKLKDCHDFSVHDVQLVRSATGKVSVVNVNCVSKLLQIIPVGLPSIYSDGSKLKFEHYPMFRIFFGLTVFAYFDLPVCRAALSFPLIPNIGLCEGSVKCFCLDMSYLNFRNNVSESRKKKYNQRILHCSMVRVKFDELIIFQAILKAMFGDFYSKCPNP
jgi:hypothetical protein